MVEHTKQQKGLRIVGYYQCNERLDDRDLSGAGKKFADRIEQLYPDSVALVVSAQTHRQYPGVHKLRYA